MPRPIQTFQVGIKGFVWNEDHLLLVQENNNEHLWELPGGRIDVGEEHMTPAEILRRELREELGVAFSCAIGQPRAAWVRPPEPRRPLPVFLLGLYCSDPRGEIELSDEHVAFQWIARDGWNQLALAPGYMAALASFFTDV